MAEGRLSDGTVARKDGSETGSFAGYSPTLKLLGKYPWQASKSRPGFPILQSREGAGARFESLSSAAKKGRKQRFQKLTMNYDQS